MRLACDCMFGSSRGAKRNQSSKSAKSAPLGWREDGKRGEVGWKREGGREDEMKWKINIYGQE